MAEFQGRRIPDSEWFERRSAGTLEPGDYGVEFITKQRDGREVEHRDWFVCLPDGSTTALWVNEDDSNGSRHLIFEHEDATITVDGSIQGHAILSHHIYGSGPISTSTWHGWLEKGVWRDV